MILCLRTFRKLSENLLELKPAENHVFGRSKVGLKQIGFTISQEVPGAQGFHNFWGVKNITESIAF